VYAELYRFGPEIGFTLDKERGADPETEVEGVLGTGRLRSVEVDSAAINIRIYICIYSYIGLTRGGRSVGASSVTDRWMPNLALNKERKLVLDSESTSSRRSSPGPRCAATRVAASTPPQASRYIPGSSP